MGERVGTLGDDEKCHRCGGENTNWAAPSPLWNLVMRGNDIDGDPQYDDMVCVRCFIVLAYEAGVDGLWRLEVEPEPDSLIRTTPSGRKWDDVAWLWREPGELLSWERELLDSAQDGPAMTSGRGHDPATLNELARLIAGDGHVRFTVRYGAAARILNAGWQPPASSPAVGGPKEADDE